MTAESPELPLAATFPDADRAQWQRLVEGVLRKSGVTEATGPATEDVLSTDLQDGIRVRPLYTAEDGTAALGHPGFPPFVRAGRPEGTTVAGWDVRQRQVHTDPQRANEAILADLENGVTSLWLTVGDGGVPVAGLEQALRGVYLDLAAVVLDAGADFAAAAEELLRLYTASGAPLREAAGCLGADPLGLLARTGDDAKLRLQLESAARMAERCAADAPGVRALAVDALPYHEAGGSAAEELGTSLATGVAYLRQLTGAGLGIDDACRQLEFRYAATADQFLTIAKLRAARRLWARVAEVCGASPAASAQRQHAVTSTVMMTRRDPWVNMLRTTVAGLSAGVGGADAVTVLPFDAALGLPDAFARRIARNTQSVLLDESHLSKVIDPAGGSWYVESLTEELAGAAWAWFQEIERAGGQAAALRSGMIADRLAATWERRTEDLAHRREPVTGVSEFPHLAEPPVHREPAPTPIGGGLPRVRRDDAYERLRSRSDAHLAAHDARPKVFLAALGPVATHTARVAFAANLFQAGGIETVQEPAAVDAESVAEAFARSGARIACLCASDAVYGEQAVAVAAALKSAGALRVHLAGKPGERRDEFAAAGVDSFVFTGCDAVEVLSSALDVMEVA
ncbi:methylmalonyl-CoA mutase subunit beta [Streptomyces tubercidicus]|uniref:Methylmalonyl-CoA mutase n=1 Tax=Streptomyces tubercidicus TaxID=47759 RepID=A0A640UPC9_9ACTN|nr:methylmalonyl-CoA mutase subunit beta [Streptomyces tubercidicus]WAU10945.1 methylmalonyl-CoA mutase subunit beta [Streptomyces tubercidicus]GFE36135.1 methylmalonyl-CoA mutase [Streptomyces tubercidicus]